MTDREWDILLRVLKGELLDPLPVGFIIDSPWLAGWAGMTTLDYFTNDAGWLEANFRAERRFPEILFLPGFWAEYGMCTEPSAFGTKCVWPEDDFPFAQKILDDYGDIRRLARPNCRTDGLCPFVIKRLVRAQKAIEREGHRIRFATSRGPLNIASFLLGHTEALVGMKTDPDAIHALLAIVTDFVVDWLRHQAAVFPSIDGLLVLDDLIGFVGPADFEEFVLPYFRQIAEALDVSVKALHNDCHGLVTARFMTAMGYNLFNFSFEHGLQEIRDLAGESVVLLGNVPPRDVLAKAAPQDVVRSVEQALASLDDKRWLILSGGGGTPPGVPSENLDAFYAAATGR
jgi:uroporphyrinogen decarboxylase